MLIPAPAGRWLARNADIIGPKEGGMPGPPMPSLESCVKELQRSALFNLSLSSKELFHSNFLGWLCQVYPDEMGALFSPFIKHPCPSCKQAHRERHNIDLTIEFANGECLIVENKVKSIARTSQLEEYSAEVKDKDHTSFLLLSLVRPSFATNSPFTLSDGTPWHYMSYAEMANLLEQRFQGLAERNPYHGTLLEDYLSFIRNLDCIASHVTIDWTDENAGFFTVEDRRLLQEIRLHDLMDKLRYGQLAQRIRETLEGSGFRVVSKEAFCKGEPPLCMVDSAIYRGQAVAEYKYLLTGPEPLLALIVMLQGQDLKLCVQSSRGSEGSALVQAIVDELNKPQDGRKLWFDLSRIQPDSREMPAHGFNQYSGPDYLIKYRYKRLRRITPTELVKTMVDYAHSVRDSEKTIRERVRTACESLLRGN
jgi:hypothetical protein